MRKTVPVEERFWAKVQKTEECWLWTASTIRGYGQLHLTTQPKKRMILAHRFAYELLVGPIPEGLELDHLCRQPLCVNPAHLEPVMHGENVRRGLSGILTTHCPKGHPYSDENTYYDGKSRECRICRRVNFAAWHVQRRRDIEEGRVTVPHGQYASYTRGCRCAECLVANRQHLREWRANHHG